MLPLSAADKKQVSYLKEYGDTILELVIRHGIKKHTDLNCFFGINKKTNTFLNVHWQEKMNTWNQKRIDHLKRFTDAHQNNAVLYVSSNKFHAALSIKNIHPCDNYKNNPEEKDLLLKKNLNNPHSKIKCFCVAYVDENDTIHCDKYLYKKQDIHVVCCNNSFAWVDFLETSNHNKNSYSQGICYDFIEKKFNKINIFAQCGDLQVSTGYLYDHTEDFCRTIYEKSPLFKKKDNSVCIDLKNIISSREIKALEKYIDKDTKSYELINLLKNLNNVFSRMEFLNQIINLTNKQKMLGSTVTVKGYGELYCSSIWNDFSFKSDNRTVYEYADTNETSNQFTQARYKHFCKNWTCGHKSNYPYFDELQVFFEKCTKIITQKKYVLRYDALNHIVRVLELNKNSQGVVTVTDHGDTKVPANTNHKTLHVKKDGTLTYTI